MLVSKMLIPTLKEVPSEAQIESHKLMLRAGLIRKMSSGLYSYLPLGIRILQKVAQIVREEMDRAGAQEVMLPTLAPRELLEMSGRYSIFGDNMMRMVDRHENEYVLGPTHEESMTNLVKNELNSYKELPMNLYQITTKFRDELRPQFGVLRTREFLMKDAYSFHTDDESLDECYKAMSEAYRRVFFRCGLETVAVKADSGAMGGSGSEEFMVRSEVGWETIVRCGKCGYVANVETAQCGNDTDDSADSPAELEMVDTPNAKTISEVSKFLGADAKSFIKTLIYEKSDGKPVMVLIRGDLDVNEIKLANVLGESEVALPTDESVRSKLGLPVGYLGPVECGVDIPLLVDHSVKGIVNGVTGGNLADMHYKNVCVGRDFEVKDYVDLRLVGGGDRCVSCGTPLDSFKGMELGHVFKLGRKYTDAYNVTYLDESGKEQRPIMGTYGIGVNRIPAAVIENGHDGNGIVWPLSIAPYQVIVVPINWNDDKQRDAAVSIYEKLKERGVEVLLDDRDMRPGVKFKDADLIGIPIRINVGDKALAKDSVELKIRDKDGFDLVLKDDICDRVTEIIAEKLRALNEC